MKRIILTLSIIYLGSFFVIAQETISINVPIGGQIKASITGAGGDPQLVKKLTLAGTIDARDFKFMRDSMPLLEDVDMEAAQIAAYSGTEGTGFDNNYPAEEVPERAFYSGSPKFSGKTSLQKIKLPSGIKRIGDEAFLDCTGLIGSLVIPASVTSIGYGAFRNTGFNGSLSLSSSLTAIEGYAFFGCSWFSGNLTIPASVTTIGPQAFRSCSGFTGELNIPSTINVLEGSVFSGCSKLTSVNIPNSVNTIADYAFYRCSGLASLVIPGSVSTIGAFAFNDCYGLAGSLKIPFSVTTIGGSAFAGCSGLDDTLFISSSVNTIGDQAFKNCSELKHIIVTQKVPLSIQANTFLGVNKSACKLIVPNSSLSAYQNALYWKDFSTIGTAIIVNFDTRGLLILPIQ